MSLRYSGPDGPLPQWDIVDGYGSGVFEATDPRGVVWRLTAVDSETGYQYLLAPAETDTEPVVIDGAGGLYAATDRAGLHIAAAAVREDPQGARRQLGLDGDDA